MMKAQRNVLLLIFMFSGFTGLIYESVWTHYLKLILGHAAYAQTLVLAIFMGGLTIGSYLCSRYSKGWRDPLNGYAGAEFAIGVLALVFHPVFERVIRYSYDVVIPVLGSPAAVNVFKSTASSLLILPQSILLGMTFPLMSAAMIRAFPLTPGSSLAMLYFTNSLGAAIGVLVSGFYLIRAVGLPGTISLAGSVNIVLSAFVWALARKGGVMSPEKPAPDGDPRAEPGAAWRRYLLFASLATGTASFIYEIGWMRMLSLVLGSSTHAFELMLGAFILGLAFGGLWVQRRLDSFAEPVRVLAIIQICMGLCALATLIVYGGSFGVMQWLLTKIPKTDGGYLLFNISSHAIALAVMFPATFCAGMTLPLITYALIKRGHGERSIGAVYAVNTIGAIIGVFFAIHLGMPLLGLKDLITVGASVNMALGLLLLRGVARHGDKRYSLAASALCLGAVSVSLFAVDLDPFKLASGVYRTGELATSEDSAVVFHKDGKTATISVLAHSNGEMSIHTNGKVDASIMMDHRRQSSSDEITMVLAAALPMVYHPYAQTAANIGLGSGLTTHTLLSNPFLTQVDTIEIERTMEEGAQYFGARVERAFNDPRGKIYIDDAKTFFSSQKKKYDIIVSEPSNPWVSGVAELFSEEFYRMIVRHLNENGLFAQWVQIYEIDMNLVASIFKAMAPSFSDFVVYVPDEGDMVIVARCKGAFGGPNPTLFGYPRLAELMARVNIESMEDIDARRIGDKKILFPFFESFSIRANSDYYPVLDQNAAQARFLTANAQDVISLGIIPLPLEEMLADLDAPRSSTNVTFSPFLSKIELVTAAMTLRDYYLKGEAASRFEKLKPEVKENARKFRRIFNECRKTGNPDMRVFLFNAAKNVIPYLSASEARAIWNKLEAGPCARRLSPMENAYVSLFKAIGNRDGAKMAGLAEFILKNESDITLDRMNYVAAAGMLGNLANGDKGASEALLSQYSARISGMGKPGLVFRFLEAQSAVR